MEAARALLMGCRLQLAQRPFMSRHSLLLRATRSSFPSRLRLARGRRSCPGGTPGRSRDELASPSAFARAWRWVQLPSFPGPRLQRPSVHP